MEIDERGLIDEELKDSIAGMITVKGAELKDKMSWLV